MEPMIYKTPMISPTVDELRQVQRRRRDGVLEPGHLLGVQVAGVPQHAPVVVQAAAAIRARKETECARKSEAVRRRPIKV